MPRNSFLYRAGVSKFAYVGAYEALNGADGQPLAQQPFLDEGGIFYQYDTLRADRPQYQNLFAG